MVMRFPDLFLYHSPGSRSGRTKMMLDLLKLSYGEMTIDMSRDEHKREPYLNIHPFGLLPSLWYRGQVILDSGAQIMFLADHFHERGYSPPISSPLRGKYLELFVLTSSLLEPVGVAALQAPDDGDAQARLHRALQLYEDRLGGLYALGDSLSAADVFIHWGLKHFNETALQDFTRLREYITRVSRILDWTGY